MGIKKSTIIVVVTFLIISLIAWHSECSAVTLEIFNGIFPARSHNVTITCSNKSKKKIMIGEVPIEFLGAPYKYECATRFFGTSCKCVLEWGEHVRTFNAYRHRIDHKICGSKCTWYLDQGAPILCKSDSNPLERPEPRRFDQWIQI
ncbi:hypothetical protein QQ045_031462 [Rhodiola kirilowii]